MSEPVTENLLELTTSGATLVLDLDVGHIRDLEFRGEGYEIKPLHTAPWVDEDPAELPDNMPPVERRLSGDFLCAPFAANDVEDAPLHGWSANSTWIADEVVQDDEKAYAKLTLEKTILGAKLEKEMLLLAGAPFLYQTHRFVGGEGSLPVAHHVMTRMKAGALFCHSPIDYAWTHDEPLDLCPNMLAYPAKSNELSRFPLEKGGFANLGEYPLAGGYEDSLTLVEDTSNVLGWTAVQRKVESDIVFVVKDAGSMPVTMLWHCNGGRWHKPWNSRHLGVLGIKDGVSFGSGGHAESMGNNHLKARGVSTCVDLVPNGTVELHLLIGAMPRPDPWTKTVSIKEDGNRLVINDRRGAEVSFPFLQGFFDEGNG